jgi:transcriptional regulator with XRE-family HTH domain
MLKKFGADLRKIRENKKITLRDIAGKTRLHISHFDKMENGDFQFFDSTYIRAILRQYAKAIGIDPENILFNYELAKNGKYNSGFLSEYLSDAKTGLKEKSDDKSDVPDILLSHEQDTKTSSKGFSVEKETSETEQIIKTDSIEPHDVFSVPESGKDNNSEISDMTTFRDGIRPEKRKFSTSKRVKIEGEKGDFNGDYYKRDGIRIPYSFLKSAGVVALVILMLAGIYLLIDIVFLQKREVKTDLIRPNFDEIVKENEKKILGKKTDEEIRDSIARETAKIDSVKKSLSDSIAFSVKAYERGFIVVVLDSLIEDNVVRETFKPGDSLIFRAKKSFWVTSKNTGNFKAYLNGTRLEFGDQNIKAVRITKKGIQKRTTQSNGNQPGKED